MTFPPCWRWLPLLCFLGLLFFFWRGLSLNPHVLPSARLNQSLPSFQLPVLGKPQFLFSPHLFDQPAQLLIVWASWCEACIEEQPFLMQLAKKGVPLYGLNYKDKTDQAIAWLAEWGNPYKVIGEDRQGRVAMDLGVYGAPEVFLIDKKGKIRYRHVGALTEADWRHAFLPRISVLEQSL